MDYGITMCRCIHPNGGCSHPPPPQHAQISAQVASAAFSAQRTNADLFDSMLSDATSSATSSRTSSLNSALTGASVYETDDSVSTCSSWTSTSCSSAGTQFSDISDWSFEDGQTAVSVRGTKKLIGRTLGTKGAKKRLDRLAGKTEWLTGYQAADNTVDRQEQRQQMVDNIIGKFGELSGKFRNMAVDLQRVQGSAFEQDKVGKKFKNHVIKKMYGNVTYTKLSKMISKQKKLLAEAKKKDGIVNKMELSGNYSELIAGFPKATLDISKFKAKAKDDSISGIINMFNEFANLFDNIEDDIAVLNAGYSDIDIAAKIDRKGKTLFKAYSKIFKYANEKLGAIETYYKQNVVPFTKNMDKAKQRADKAAQAREKRNADATARKEKTDQIKQEKDRKGVDRDEVIAKLKGTSKEELRRQHNSVNGTVAATPLDNSSWYAPCTDADSLLVFPLFDP